MKTWETQLTATLSALFVSSVIAKAATTRYVDVNSPNPTPPYTNWNTAATIIQDAVNTTGIGDEVVVTNGVYAAVSVVNPIVLRSVNGASVTTIDGASKVRCVDLSGGASLSGFTLTNGVADYGGGVRCASSSTWVSNCVIVGNSASEYGGGAYSGSLHNCALIGNLAGAGGGASGDLSQGLRIRLVHCNVVGNSAQSWGGVQQGSMDNCIIYANNGLGSYPNCSPYDVVNFTCTTPLPTSGAGNMDLNPNLSDAMHLGADSPCRGAGSATASNGTDIDGETWTTPPSIGCDEYSASFVPSPPEVTLAAAYTNVLTGFVVELTATITGISTGSVFDFGDGAVSSIGPYSGRMNRSHAWTAPGDYAVVLRAFNQSYPNGVTATQVVHVALLPVAPIYYVAPDSPLPTSPYTNWATAAHTIQEAIDAIAAVPNPGTCVLVTNGVYATGGRAVYGKMTNRVVVDKPVTVHSVNGPQFTSIRGDQDGAIRCVYLTNGASLSGFTLTNGATRAVYGYPTYRESAGGGVWCESQSAMISNCVITRCSAQEQGGGAYRGTLRDCSLLSNSVTDAYNAFGGGVSKAVLENCILTGNSAKNSGGGANGCTLGNCTLVGNSATENGGGALGGTLDTCVLVGNSAGFGGGAYGGDFGNCTVVGNSAVVGGGVAHWGSLRNSIICFNTAPTGPNHYAYGQGLMDYCCTTPLPDLGVGNITNAPLFVSTNNWSDLRLQSNSPCINAGRNVYARNATDMGGLPRIVGGTVDIGASEYQGSGSLISYAWLQQYAWPTDGSADFLDPDGDRINNWQEWRADTIPTNALSVLRMVALAKGASGVTVSWQSMGTRSYWVERGTNPTSADFFMIQSTVNGQTGTTSYRDANADGMGPFFYRVGVQE